jgi:hypothetical protein
MDFIEICGLERKARYSPLCHTATEPPSRAEQFSTPNPLTRLLTLNQEEKKPGHQPGFSFLGKMATNVRNEVRT